MKKKFLKLNLRLLKNEAWFNFFLEFKGFTEQFSPYKLGIEQEFAQFIELLQKSDIALEHIRKSALTSDVKRLDNLRDNAFRTLKAAWKLGLAESDSIKHEAAKRVGIIFHHFGNLAAKPYNEATAGIINFIQELTGKYAIDSEILQLMPRIALLAEANNAFEAVIIERNAEIADRPDLKMVELRHETDRCYVSMLERIEAKALLDGGESLNPFFRTLNTNIERYKPHRRKKDDEETGEEIG